MRRIVILTPAFGPPAASLLGDRDEALARAGLRAQHLAADHLSAGAAVHAILPLPEKHAPAYETQGRLTLHRVGVHPGRTDATAAVKIAHRLAELALREPIDHIDTIADTTLAAWARFALHIGGAPEPAIDIHAADPALTPAPIDHDSPLAAWQALERAATHTATHTATPTATHSPIAPTTTEHAA